MALFRNNGRSSTSVVEAIPTEQSIEPQVNRRPSTSKSLKATTEEGYRRKSRDSRDAGVEVNQDDRREVLPIPTTSSDEIPTQWNHPRINVYRTLSTFWSLFVMGMNDATYGAIIPYLETYYGLSYTVVSLIFLSPFGGYNLSAVLNNSIHLKFGQRGVALLVSGLHTFAYIIICIHPPYPVLVIVFIVAGFANGLSDSAWNAYIGDMDRANEVLGFLHASYGLGATIAPLVATYMITKAHLQWYEWYYVMIAAGVIEFCTTVPAFWKVTGAAFRESHPRTTEGSGSRMKEALLKKPSARVVWLCALFLLGYVGVEVAVGGWIVVFMLRVRHGSAFSSGMIETGFWLGITVGRLVLGFVTPRIGEKLSIGIYLPIAMALQLIFWLVPQFYVSAVAVSLQGFFLGPMFPAAVVACTKLLPRHLHVSGIGFAAAFGGSGGALFPFIVGLIAQSKGVQVLQPIILALLVVVWLLWLGLPRIERKRD